MTSFNELENVNVCDLCSSTKLISLHEPTWIMSCENCNFVFTSPRPTFAEIEKSYSDAHFYDNWVQESKGRKKLWQKRFRRLFKYLNPKAKILDYSAGVGTFLDQAREKSFEVYGTEISTSAKKIAYNTYGIRMGSDNELLSEERRAFYDTITAWHVVEHVSSPSHLLTTFNKALKPEGLLVIAVPNNQHRTLKQILLNRPIDLHSLYPALAPGGEIHLSHFNINSLSFSLKKTGFSLLYCGIDDHSANPDFKSNLKHFLYTGIWKLSGKNLSETIFVIARKK